MENNELYKKLETVEVVAAMLKMTPQALYEASRSGLVPSVRIGRRVRWDIDALQTWLECGGSPWCDNKRNTSKGFLEGGLK